jgi:hypothetical protein
MARSGGGVIRMINRRLETCKEGLKVFRTPSAFFDPAIATALYFPATQYH